LPKILECKQAKQQLINYSQTKKKLQYNALNKEVKASAAKYKEDFIENLVAEAENASIAGNSRLLFSIIKQLCNKALSVNTPINDKSGKILTQEEKQTKTKMG
jgi:hypothetical protein